MIVVDASAIVAILAQEPEANALTAALDRASERTTSPVTVYEAALGLHRILRRSVEDAEADVMEFLRLARVTVRPILPEVAHGALTAFARYGKRGGHAARLNLEDCFIDAQARLSSAALLFKGEDFSKTDIESAA